MTAISAERAQARVRARRDDEGEAFWLLGMLQTIKIGRDDTGGAYGLVEIVVPEGVGSPWHVHPEEDEWFYVLEGELTFWVADTRLSLHRRLVRVRPQGRAAHLLRRGGRSKGAGRLRADAVRRIPARGRRAGPRTRPAAAGRGPPGHGAAAPDRPAKRVRDPRAPQALRPATEPPRRSRRTQPPPGPADYAAVGYDFDLLVIGSGPAGQKAAIQAAKLGRRVAVVERGHMIGGVCINTGTIPSKTLREAVLYLTGMNQRGIYGQSYRVKADITAHDLFWRIEHVIEPRGRRGPEPAWPKPRARRRRRRAASSTRTRSA